MPVGVRAGLFLTWDLITNSKGKDPPSNTPIPEFKVYLFTSLLKKSRRVPRPSLGSLGS